MIENTLATFLENARSNQLANKSACVDWYIIIQAIDNCFVKNASNPINSQSDIVFSLFLRCQYAYRTAVGLAFAGQASEAFVMLRSVLEYAGYALLIHENPKLQSVWLSRNVSQTKKNKQKNDFTTKNVYDSVKRHDARLREIFEENYQRTLDFGGHPNPHAVLSYMLPNDGEGQFASAAHAFCNYIPGVQHTLKSTGQIGLTALYVFKHVFTAKFELLGISRAMEDLRATNRL